jgi:hypothetical protein
MKGQLTIEFLFAAAAYLAFIFILISANNSVLVNMVAATNGTYYTAEAQYLAILYSIKEINSPNLAYPIAPTCTISQSSVICGSKTEKFTMPIYVYRTGVFFGKEII